MGHANWHVLKHCRIVNAFCALWYYHAIPKNNRSNKDNQAEVFLNRIEMQDLRDNFDFADGYISRFLPIFKPFVHMNNQHPRSLHIELQKTKHFRDTFESEFGKTITCQHEINLWPEIEIDLWQLLLDFIDVLYASCKSVHMCA